MLTFNNVEFKYSNQEVFNNLNLQLNQGDFAFLIGKSGVGKSTLLQLVYMDILPQAGYVQVGEFSSDTIKPNKLPKLRKMLGVVFQDFKLLEDRNVYNNLAFVLHVTGTPRKVIKEKIMSALRSVGLEHKYKNMPSQLSGGEKQRVAIARAVINNPKLILADEPTGNLDPKTSDEIMSILHDINSRGTAVLFATHNYDLVKKTEAKIFKIDNGKALKVKLKTKSAEEEED
ncbi:MAG: cell division ATP-binding protein FtsE [Ignavibacteriae bacterium]|nr:cell division ATP-binding protein FtsE [Ignavibacteriota bacterium]MCB9209738.1 cell division ATP-binding protein FtsE [Ignavibacteriales bacterium]MCB9218894.1 cell division ATP-binding protein FtsE [Ignavibacteriales bacterium]